MSGRPHKWRDTAWKQAIIDGAREAIEYFMPDLASVMDASREITVIAGMELPRAGSDSDKGMLVSDVFLNVPVADREDWGVACLAEQQHEDDKDFARQMFDSYVRLRAQRPAGRTTCFAIYTGSSKNASSYTESCYGMEATIKFRTFHVPSYSVEELREDKHPFARVMYAGRLSFGSENDVALREKYLWEFLSTTDGREYDERQRKFILEFADRIFWLKGPGISQELREAYKMRTMSLEEYSKLLAREEGIMIGREEGMEKGMEKGMEIGREEGMEKGKLEFARNLLIRGISPDIVAESAQLSREKILELMD